MKSMKDPDVKDASSIYMTVFRYRKYRDAYDKIQDIYKKHGTDSTYSLKKVNEIISSLPNMNEWRRYCELRSQKQKDKWIKEYDKLFNDE